jgi:hypothetical protein
MQLSIPPMKDKIVTILQLQNVASFKYKELAAVTVGCLKLEVEKTRTTAYFIGS